MADTDTLLTTRHLLDRLQVDPITIHRILNSGRLQCIAEIASA